MRREILSSFCILPASLFHSFTRSVSFPLPLTSLSIFLPRSEPTQFPHPYLVILLSFFPISFCPSPSPGVLLHTSTPIFFSVLPLYGLATLLQMFCMICGSYQMFYSQHETMTSLFWCKRLQHMRLLVHQ